MGLVSGKGSLATSDHDGSNVGRRDYNSKQEAREFSGLLLLELRSPLRAAFIPSQDSSPQPEDLPLDPPLKGPI